MNSIIIILPDQVIIQEWWSSPQYQHLGVVMKAVCFLIGLLCYRNHSYPRKGLYLGQMFPDLSIDYIKKGIIVYRKNL